MIGRVLRPAPDKPDAIILDHAGAVFRHGFAEDHVEWTLDPDRRAESTSHQERSEYGSSSRLLECTQCGAIREGGKPCFHCGFLPQKPPKNIIVEAGELGLVDGGRRVQASIYDPAARAQWHAMLIWIGYERGYEKWRGWAAHKFKDRFGTFPAWGSSPEPLAPTPEVRSWVRSRDIAYAKGRRQA